jgi:hypothetical protein
MSSPKIGFAILSHRPPKQVFTKLLQYLKNLPGAVIGLHHDYSQSDFPQDIINEFDIKVVNPSMNTKWGHISKVPATLEVFKLLYEQQPELDWFITVSPNCYAVKSHQYLLDFLKNTQYDVFMELMAIAPQGHQAPVSHYTTLFSKHQFYLPFISRKGKFYMRDIRKAIDPETTPFNSKLKPFTGSDWFILNRKAMKAILDADIPNHPAFHYLAEANLDKKRNASPIEILVQTFIANNKELKIKSDNFYRYIDWEGTTEWHPRTLVMTDYERIKNSDALFARKFNDEESLPLIAKIDSEIINK